MIIVAKSVYKILLDTHLVLVIYCLTFRCKAVLYSSAVIGFSRVSTWVLFNCGRGTFLRNVLISSAEVL